MPTTNTSITMEWSHDPNARQVMLIGYARVSTQDQNLELQREALTKALCQKVFEDKVSGTRADRPGLASSLSDLSPADR